MENIKNKKLSKLVQIPNISKMNVKNARKDTPMREAVMDDMEYASKKKYTNKNQTQQKKVQAASHTEADINWATIANKITISNIVKGGMTVGGAGACSCLGAGIGTALGFVFGPGAAAAGYYVGTVAGMGVGCISGHKFGKYVANKIDDEEQNNVFEKGNTKINVDTVTEIDTEKRTDKNGFF